MHRHRTRGRPLWLLFAALAAALVLGILGLGLAKGVVRSDSPLPPEKQEIEERIERERLEALARPQPPKNPNYIPPFTPGPQPSPCSDDNSPCVPAGAGTIVETQQARYSPMVFSFQNHWFEVKDGQYVVVFAGREGSAGDPSQGVVVVEVDTMDFMPVAGGGIYRTPIKDGAVRIVGADGERLTLTSASGATFIFDVASRTFVSPSGPAPTPLAPTPTPVAPTLTPVPTSPAPTPTPVPTPLASTLTPVPRPSP
ncbi:MAG: hypothetical protein Q8P22_04585 [Chloroflexota bacterium]|nr:hypothetical protein [Chloroflexota bacterium]